MQELGLLLLLLAALSAGKSQSEDGCHRTGKSAGEVAVCGDTRELESSALQAVSAAAAPEKRPAGPVRLPGEGLASGSKPIGPADLEDLPKGRRY